MFLELLIKYQKINLSTRENKIDKSGSFSNWLRDSVGKPWMLRKDPF